MQGSGPYIFRSQPSQDYVTKAMAKLAETLPYREEFEGLDFTNSPIVLGVNIEVVVGDLYLALKRSEENSTHKGYYNNVAGHIIGRTKFDILRSAFKELGEEIGLFPPFNGNVRVGGIIQVPRQGQMLHLVAVRVELDEPHEVLLNGEHTEALWLPKAERARLWPQVQSVSLVERHFSTSDLVSVMSPIAIEFPTPFAN